MQHFAPFALIGGLTVLSPLAHAVGVQNLDISGFSFQVTTQGGSASSTVNESTALSVIDPGAGNALNGGAAGPILSFFLTDPLGRGTGMVSITTTAAGLPAHIDTATNSVALDLSSFTFNWDTGAAPSLCTIKVCTQPQALGVVSGATGSWNPATNAFSIGWSYVWSGDTALQGEDHPFPEGTSTWALSGVAAPVPEPGQWVLLLAGLGIVASRMKRRDGGSSAAS